MMTDRETGQILERVDHLTHAVEALTTEMLKMRETQAYGKGVLAGLLFLAGVIGASVEPLVKVLWR